ncbi:cupin domain-containing protein [Rubrobacter tropicus]|uniref:Cupin domain-containing protein n=1 Tax=Rubrobacter tropicus TaxID=2653851 RepID=A0A6G8QDU7_9ACTN|nr:cupin domain-containing protein [Rubrobacter tropicus]QIN84571.1 cupin domain-containing protein [Rubrobacter tropicus]
MRIIEPESGTTRAAPVEGGPTVEVLVGGDGAESGNLAAARVTVPPGGRMPEHDHGESEALMIVQSGRVVIREGGREETLAPGKMASIGIGERVSLENPSSSEPASLLAFFAPPAFARTFGAWPSA